MGRLFFLIIRVFSGHHPSAHTSFCGPWPAPFFFVQRAGLARPNPLSLNHWRSLPSLLPLWRPAQTRPVCGSKMELSRARGARTLLLANAAARPAAPATRATPPRQADRGVALVCVPGRTASRACTQPGGPRRAMGAQAPPGAARPPTSTCSAAAAAASSAGDPDAWRALAAAAAADGFPDGTPPSAAAPSLPLGADWRALEAAIHGAATSGEEDAWMHAAPPSWPAAASRAWGAVRAFVRSRAGRAAARGVSVGSSLLFVALYVWSTYSPPPPGSARAAADAALCVIFAADYVIRLAQTQAGNRWRTVLAFGNVLDFLAVFPPLLELLLRSFAGGGGAGPAVAAGRGAARAAAAAGALASLGAVLVLAWLRVRGSASVAARRR